MNALLLGLLLGITVGGSASANWFYEAGPPPISLAAKTTARYLHVLGLWSVFPTLLNTSTYTAVAPTGAGTSLLPTFLFSTSHNLPAGVVLQDGCSPALNAPSGAFAVCRSSGAGDLVTVIANDAPGVLYGSISFLERLGLRFTLSGAVLPTLQSIATGGGVNAALAPGARLSAAPVFDMRGLQPFHDFYEGPGE